MPLPEVEDILKKYKEEEEKVDRLFQEIARKEEEVSKDDEKQNTFLAYEEAKERNKNILRDLETVKGNLRSKAIFSPTEMQWETVCKRYQEEPSLVVTTWRCNLPIFV